VATTAASAAGVSSEEVCIPPDDSHDGSRSAPPGTATSATTDAAPARIHFNPECRRGGLGRRNVESPTSGFQMRSALFGSMRVANTPAKVAL
jgi:hypothetical protein